MKIHFSVCKQQLNRLDDDIIASFSKNFLQCSFCFEDEWTDVYKYALFTDVDGNQYVVELGMKNHVDCLVPEEVLQNNYFLLSVFGGDRLTTTQETILVQPSGLNSSILNGLENGSLETTTSSLSDDYYRKIVDEYYCYRHNLFEIHEHPYY